MSEGVPTLRFEGAIATIQLNRPSVHNRMEPEDLTVLGGLLDRIEAEPALRVVLLTATGKSFSSGFNIGKLNGNDGDAGGDGSFDKVVDRLERFALPTICALNGGVYGGSTDLALSCDFRIGVEGMGMFMPAARLGPALLCGGHAALCVPPRAGRGQEAVPDRGQAGHGRDADGSATWTRPCQPTG